MKYIITCNENSKHHLIEELAHHDVDASLEWFNETDALLEIGMNFSDFKKLHDTTPLVFIRHFFPVQKIIKSHEALNLTDFIVLSDREFSIQLRSPQESRKEMTANRNTWVDTLIAKGNTLNVKNPEMVISVYATSDLIYFGLSHIDDLPTRWSAGEIHFSKKIDSISRAEFKLREVFDTFPLNPVGDVAVDLGAAPGGWTRVLHEMEYEVYAIDPSDLDFRLVDVEGINHFQMTSQQFVKENPHFECDILVNDMKMDARASISLFKEAAKQLNQDGYGIITIKLAKDFEYQDVIDALELLRLDFNIEYARQLFHNRSEFTVIVTPL